MSVISPSVSAEQNAMTNENIIQTVPLPTPTLIPTQNTLSLNDGKRYPIHITDLREYVSSWNEKMDWNISYVSISETVDKLESSQGPLSVLKKDEDGFFYSRLWEF